MGMTCASGYAKLYLGWEREIFSSPLLGLFFQVSWWLFWQGTQDEFHAFLLILNQNNWNLTFTHVFGGKSIVFLDMELSILEDGSVHSTLHCKALLETPSFMLTLTI